MENIQQPDSVNSKSNGSDNSTINNVSPLLTTKPLYGRCCHIVKRPNFDGYGFNLHSEKIKPGQYIGKVDPDSPAEAAGLREGDQIIEVNGVNIGAETHKQVVQRIKAISNEVRLLLIDPNTESVSTSNKIPTTNFADTAEKINNNSNSTSTQKTSPTLVSLVVEAKVDAENQNDEVISNNLNSGKVQSTLNEDQTLDVTDSNTNEDTIINNYHSTTTTIINGNSSEIRSSKVTTPPPIITTPPLSSEQQMMDSSYNKSLPSHEADTQSLNKPGLNLNLTAAEMRAKLLAKKKFDPKNDSVDLKKKFDIIQKL